MADTNMADQTQSDLNEMRQAGRQAKEVAKSTAKVTTKAVNGAVKGAQKAAKAISRLNPAKVKLIMTIATICCVFFLLSALMSLPNLLYAPIQSVVENWEEVKYTDAHDGNIVLNVGDFLWRVAEDGAGAIGGFFEGIGNFISGFMNTGMDDADDPASNLTEKDMDVFESQASSQLTMIKMALSVNNKYSIRANHVKKAIDQNTDLIEDYLTNLQFDEDTWTDDVGNEETYDNYTVTFQWNDDPSKYGIRPMGTDTTSRPSPNEIESELNELIKDVKNATTQEELEQKQAEYTAKICELFPITGDEVRDGNIGAMSLLSLYAVQTGMSVTDLKTADLMKYLGYPSGGTDNTKFDIGGVATGTVKNWGGSFLPQYLMEEIFYYKTLKGEAETNLEMATTDEAKATYQSEIDELDAKLAQYNDQGMALMDLIVTLDFPNLHLRDYAPEDEEQLGDPTPSTTTGHGTRYSPWENSVVETTKYVYQTDGAIGNVIRIDTKTTITQRWKQREFAGYEWVANPIPAPAPAPSAAPGASPAPETPGPVRPADYPSEDPGDGNEWVKQPVYEWVEYTNVIHNMNRQYTINYSIYAKDPTSIVYMVGLFRGDFDPTVGQGGGGMYGTQDPTVTPDVTPSDDPDSSGNWSID